MAIAENKKFFHWFLEFPEVLGQEGFDCILGNPPFLGGKKLSGNYGNNFLEYLKYTYKPIGAVDLVTYFFRRIFDIIKINGFQSLISTNTIAQGATREGGLDVICSGNGVINHAVRSKKWPGKATVEVSLITIHKGEWKKPFILDNKSVERITPYLDDSETSGKPKPLLSNKGKSFAGSVLHGEGFILTPKKALALIDKDPRNKEVLFPYLSGRDFNDSPIQEPSRWVINFFDWSEEKAKTYPDCYHIIEKLVKPKRQRWKKDNQGNELVGTYALRKPLPQKWWLYRDKTLDLYNAISEFELDQVMVVGQTIKYPSFDFVNADQVLDVGLVVITSQDFCDFAILNSDIHFSWIVKYASTLGAGLRYTPTALFETFPFPFHYDKLESIGREFHKKRRHLTVQTDLGFTKIYNLFHSEKLKLLDNDEDINNDKIFESKNGKDAVYLKKHLQSKQRFSIENYNACILKIVELRKLQIELDKQVLDVYGWSDIDLNHNFHQIEYLSESDNIRFTIHSDSRKEILKRLLMLNHQYYKEQSSENSKNILKKRSKSAATGAISLFDED